MFVRDLYKKAILREGDGVAKTGGGGGGGGGSVGGGGGSLAAETQASIGNLTEAVKSNQVFSSAAGLAQAQINMANTGRAVTASVGR